MKRILKATRVLFVWVSFLIVSALGSADGYAEEKEATKLEEVVVTATRTETSIEHIADSVTIITGEEIAEKGQASVYDVLKDVPGLSLSQSGGYGNWTKVRMRGGEDRHIKLLVNGTSVGDYATGITKNYDLWNFVGTDDIERIEIIRGPQSALYGSDAISGVINIITKKGKGKPKFFLTGEGGSMDTYRASGGVNGSIENFSYNVTLSHNESGGIYRYSEFDSEMISTRFGYQFDKDKELNLSLQYTDSELNIGGQSSDRTWKVYDDPRAFRNGHLFFSNLDFQQRITPFWEHKLTMGYDNIEKKHNDPDDGILDVTDNIKDSWSKAEYIAATQKANWQHSFFFGKINTLTAGIDYEDIEVERDNLSASSHKVHDGAIDTKSLYLQNQLLLLNEALSFICGGRIDDHNAFGTHSTFSLKLAYFLKNYGTKLKTTYGTGFAAPSIFNLYDPQYGNPDLNPEESKSWEVGVEQKFFRDKVALEAVYFDNEFENLIAYDYTTLHYVNRARAESHGVEAGLRFLPLEDLSVSVSYTFTKGKENGADLAQVPRDNWKFNVSYQPGKLKLNADLYYVGERENYNQKAANRLDSYYLVNFSAAYPITNYLNIFGRVENLLDENYITSLPYEAPGMAGYGGVKVTW
ncbi:MAG: TonB-dependent receptor [Pseudomonadota bacterium]